MKILKTNSEEKKNYSIKDLRLKRYIDLSESIKAMTAELDQIKDEIRHEGTHSTQYFVAVVADRSRTNPPNLTTLIKVYGKEVEKLCTESHYKAVTVTRKGGGDE